MFVLIILTILIKFIVADLKIESVAMKPLRIGDIGLNFDMTVSNVNGKATYNFKVGSGKCCVYVKDNDTECSSKIVGGSFGDISPEKTKVVTLIWPTVVIFNRVGYCDITLTATRSYTDKVRLEWRIDFNTTFDAHTRTNKIFNYIPKSTNLSKCSFPDQDPLDRCAPINCEAKYMGKRNFYNPEKRLCEPVPQCNHAKEEIYDYIQNECVILSKVLTQSDLERLKAGEFDDLNWEPSLVASPFSDNFDYSGAAIEEEKLRKNKMFASYAIYFTVVNCAIVVFITCVFYCILGLMVSSALGGFRARKICLRVDEKN